MWHSYKKNLWSWHLWVYPTFGKHPNVKRPPHSPPNCGGLALALSSPTNSAQSSQSRPGSLAEQPSGLLFKRNIFLWGQLDLGHTDFSHVVARFLDKAKEKGSNWPRNGWRIILCQAYLYFACGPFKKPRQTNPCCRQWSCAHVSIVLPEFLFMGYSALRSKSPVASWYSGLNSAHSQPMNPTEMAAMSNTPKNCPLLLVDWDLRSSRWPSPSPGLLLTPATNPSIVYSRTSWDDWFVSKFGLK